MVTGIAPRGQCGPQCRRREVPRRARRSRQRRRCQIDGHGQRSRC